MTTEEGEELSALTEIRDGAFLWSDPADWLGQSTPAPYRTTSGYSLEFSTDKTGYFWKANLPTLEKTQGPFPTPEAARSDARRWIEARKVDLEEKLIPPAGSDLF